MALLEVQHLSTYLHTARGVVKAVDDVSFAIAPGETLALVGESGCGKSMTALSIARLLPDDIANIEQGRVMFSVESGGVPGKTSSPANAASIDLACASESVLQKIRGAQIGMIFQEPMTALNPVLTIGEQLTEIAAAHTSLARAEQTALAIDWLTRVGIPEPAMRMRSYPHELSGGLRQRAMIAMALMLQPQLVIADEPTTALDVTVQAQVLALLDALQRELGLSLLLITHDLGVVAHMADRMAVMYAGKIVEEGPVAELFANPRHPYTAGLLRAMPRLARASGDQAFATIPGRVPDLAHLPVGCAYASRCPRVQETCRRTMPELTPSSDVRAHRCYFPLEASS